MSTDPFSPVDGQLYLYGPSGSGKTAVGRQLAASLELPFYDLDSAIEARRGQGIPEIFADQGEPAFRRLEREELESILEQPAGVVALGGGALTVPETHLRVEASGKVLLLTASLETLLDRLQQAPELRPLLADDLKGRLSGLLEQRADHYASFPLRLDTTRLTVEEAAWQAQAKLGAFRVRGMGQPYDVRVRIGGLLDLGAALQARGLRGPLILVSDSHAGPLYAEGIANALRSHGYTVQTILIPAGEGNKTMQTVMGLWEGFLSAGVERDSTILALGGGVVGDLAGFAAATFLRGVRWVSLPTTLLAMVDASLGGKTGADLPQGKNLVGAFHPPSLVLADPVMLNTLPEVELRSGLAEIAKHGLIGDAELFNLLRDPTILSRPPDRLEEVIQRAIAVKVRVIEADPYEHGPRAALNLGHTVGHAVELASGFRLKHGQAVTVGLVTEARLAEQLGIAQTGLADEIRSLLEGLGLPTEIPPRLSREAILRLMGVDKKRLGGKLRFTLPVRVGEVVTGVEINDFRWLLEDEP